MAPGRLGAGPGRLDCRPPPLQANAQTQPGAYLTLWNATCKGSEGGRAGEPQVFSNQRTPPPAAGPHTIGVRAKRGAAASRTLSRNPSPGLPALELLCMHWCSVPAPRQAAAPQQHQELQQAGSQPGA